MTRPANKRFSGGLRGERQLAAADVKGRAPALLALHGFGCVPDEVKLLSDIGIEQGLTTRAPLLPGHGTTVADFSTTRYSDWYSASEAHLLELSQQGPVIIGGQSMGAVLSLDLAANHPQLCAGLVLLANAVRLASPFPRLVLKLAALARIPDFSLPKWGGPDLRDPVQAQAHTTYEGQPFHAAESLQQAGERVLEQLTGIHCPTFIGHGALDRTTPASNAWLVADRLGTTDVEVHLFANSGHILTKDLDRESLRERLYSFVRRVAQQSTHSPSPLHTPVDP